MILCWSYASFLLFFDVQRGCLLPLSHELLSHCDLQNIARAASQQEEHNRKSDDNGQSTDLERLTLMARPGFYEIAHALAVDKDSVAVVVQELDLVFCYRLKEQRYSHIMHPPHLWNFFDANGNCVHQAEHPHISHMLLHKAAPSSDKPAETSLLVAMTTKVTASASSLSKCKESLCVLSTSKGLLCACVLDDDDAAKACDDSRCSSLGLLCSASESAAAEDNKDEEHEAEPQLCTRAPLTAGRTQSPVPVRGSSSSSPSLSRSSSPVSLCDPELSSLVLQSVNESAGWPLARVNARLRQFEASSNGAVLSVSPIEIGARAYYYVCFNTPKHQLRLYEVESGVCLAARSVHVAPIVLVQAVQTKSTAKVQGKKATVLDSWLVVTVAEHAEIKVWSIALDCLHCVSYCPAALLRPLHENAALPCFSRMPSRSFSSDEPAYLPTSSSTSTTASADRSNSPLPSVASLSSSSSTSSVAALPWSPLQRQVAQNESNVTVKYATYLHGTEQLLLSMSNGTVLFFQIAPMAGHSANQHSTAAAAQSMPTAAGLPPLPHARVLRRASSPLSPAQPQLPVHTPFVCSCHSSWQLSTVQRLDLSMLSAYSTSGGGGASQTSVPPSPSPLSMPAVTRSPSSSLSTTASPAHSRCVSNCRSTSSSPSPWLGPQPQWTDGSDVQVSGVILHKEEERWSMFVADSLGGVKKWLYSNATTTNGGMQSVDELDCGTPADQLIWTVDTVIFDPHCANTALSSSTDTDSCGSGNDWQESLLRAVRKVAAKHRFVARNLNWIS